MDLDLEVRRNLDDINHELTLMATLPAADALKLSQKPSRLRAKDLVAKLRSWTQTGSLDEDQLRLTELLPCVAEVAVKELDFGTAEACVSWYLSLSFPRDQFYCRALFVRAKCLAQHARTLQGHACVTQVQYAIHWILQAIKLALEPTSRPHYDFLVYNATVTYWHVARPLLRPGSARHLVESMQTMLDSLKAINETDKAWIVRYEIALATSYEDDNQLAKAAKLINDAADHALALVASAKASDAAAVDFTNQAAAAMALFEEASLVQVHIGRHKDPECAKSLAAAKKNMVSKRHAILLNLQSIKSKLTPPEGVRPALLDLFAATTGVKFEAVGHGIPDDGSIEWENIVEVAIVAVQCHHQDIAKTCERVVVTSKRLNAHVRVMADLLRCLLALEPDQPSLTGAPTPATTPAISGLKGTPEQTPASVPTASAVQPTVLHLDKRQRDAQRLAQHVECVKVLERSLAAAKRLGHTHLIQDICLFAWNVALPLVESHLRKHVHRLFQSATSLLEELESPLVALRAQMHLETAKCEMDCDYLAKAAIHVNKALQLDYGGTAAASTSAKTGYDAGGKPTSPDGQAKGKAQGHGHSSAPPQHDTTQRPLDKHLLPMKRVLDLKSNLYGEPDAIEDQALIIIEQSKEAHDKALKATLLNKAIDLLELNAPTEGLASTALERFALWHDIAKLAWGLKNAPMTRKAAAKALKFTFNVDEAQCILQGELHFVLAETYVGEIKSYEKDPSVSANDLRLGTRVGESNQGSDVEPHATIATCKKQVVAEVMLGLQRGLETKAPWVVLNAATYLWNYHCHLFRKPVVDRDLDLILPDVAAAFNTVFQALVAPDSAVDPHQLPLLSCIAQGLTILHRDDPSRMEGFVDAVLKRSDHLPILHRKALIEIKTTIQLDRGAKDAVVGDTTPMKVVSCVRALEVQVELLQQLHTRAADGAPPGDDEKTLVDKASTYFQKAIQLWTPFATDAFASTATVEPVLEMEQQKREFYAEMWVRLGKAALALHKTVDTQKFCQEAVAPLHASDIPRAFLTPSIWRWYALAQVVWAQAILQLAADTEAQEKDVKHELALFAIKHLLLGAEFAVRAGNTSLVHMAARIMWNGMLGILDVNGTPNPSFRQKLTHDMHNMLDHLTAVESSQWSFRVDFVCALLDVYEEQQAWEAGLSTVEAAFAVIPTPAQRPLWRYRVVFMSKLGKSVQDGFAKMKENDVLLQARVSKRIAVSTTDPGAQYKALYRAVKDLTGKVEQAQFLVEIAEWFYTNQFPLQDVHDLLHGTKRRRAHESCGCEWMMRSSVVGAIHILVPVVHRGHDDDTASKKGTIKKRRKDVEHAVPPLEYWHLDLLLRIYVMLALAGRSSQERFEYVVVALAHVAVIWDALATEHLNLQYRDLFEARQQTDRDGGGVDDPSSMHRAIDDFDEWKALNVSGMAVAPGLVVPRSTKEWAAFDVEPHVPMLCGRTTHAKASLLMLHPGNVTQPTLTIHYLSKLTQLAVEFHQHPHVLSCLWLAKAVVIGTATTTTSSMAGLGDDIPLMPITLDLQLAKTLEKLCYHEASQMWLKRALDALLHTCQSSGSVVTVDKSMAQLQLVTESSLRHRPVVTSKYNVLQLCVDIADALLEFGYHLRVKQLLDIATVHCNAVGDSATLARVDVCRGKLFMIEGERATALRHFQAAAATEGLDVQAYTTYVALYGTTLCQQGQPKAGKAALQHAIHVVNQLPKLPLTSTQIHLDIPPPSSTPLDVDLVQGLAVLQAAYAALLVHESSTLLATGGDWTGVWAEAGRVYSEVVAMLAKIGGTFGMVSVASTYANVLTTKLCEMPDSDDAVAMLQRAREVLLLAHSYIQQIWEATDNPRVDIDVCTVNSVVLAAAFAQIKAQLGRLELQQHLLGQEHKMVVYQVESDAKKNLIELWLEQTAPRHKKAADEMQLPPLEKALLYFNAAVALSQLAPSPSYKASIGRCLRLQLQQNSTDAGVWTFTTDALRKQGIACSSAPSSGHGDTTNQQLEDVARLLLSALDLALAQKDRAAIEECTYELMQCYGCVDPASAVKFLLWYQSCRTSVVAEGLLLEACAPTNRTALFVQRMHLLPATSAPAQLAALYLEHESEAWRRLAVTPTIDATLAHLPPHMVLFSLQLSTDGCYLYGAIQPSPASTSHGAGVPLVARLELHSPRRVALKELVTKLKAWRASTVKSLLQYSDAMMGEHDWFEFTDATPNATEVAVSEDTLEDQFQALMDEAKRLLGPFLDCFHDVLKVLKGTSDESNVLFVVDPAVESIPFEAMMSDVLDARDLSVHMLAIRLQNVKATPYKKEDLFFIADPQNDADVDSADNPHSISATLTALKSIAPTIKGLSGKKYVPSAGEWQAALTGRRGGGLLFYGPNRSLAHFAPSHVAGLSALKCNLVVSMSRMENYASYRRQSKLDTHKPKRVLSLEDGWESAVLWSLCGANCVVTNQWNTSFVANHRVLTGLFSQLAKNVPVAKALKRTGDVWIANTKVLHNGTKLKARVRFNPIVYGLPHLP